MKMISFSLFSFSYPANLHELLLTKPADSTNEKITYLRTKCQEILLDGGTKDIKEIIKLILNKNQENYLALYSNYENDFIFSKNEKIIETLMYQNKKILFRIFSKQELELSEMMYYLFYKGLDINQIKPYGHKHSNSSKSNSKTRFY